MIQIKSIIWRKFIKWIVTGYFVLSFHSFFIFYNDDQSQDIQVGVSSDGNKK